MAANKILFVPMEDSLITNSHKITCYSYFYHWAVFGKQLLAEAVVIGGTSNNILTIAGPNLVREASFLDPVS